MTKPYLNIGQKIKTFRTQAGMSQLELELSIGAAQGSMSRIESGKVNPSKETLSKVADVLKLSPDQISELLGIKILSTEQLVKAIQTISKSLDLETTLQTAVDIMFNLFPNYNGGLICVLDKNNPNYLYGRTVSKMPFIERVHRLIPQGFHSAHLVINKHPNNLMGKSSATGECYQSESLYDFGVGVMKKIIVDLIAQILGFQIGLSVPLHYENKVIGVTLYTKRIKEQFSEYEKDLLKLLSDQIAIAIVNAEKYQQSHTDEK